MDPVPSCIPLSFTYVALSLVLLCVSINICLIIFWIHWKFIDHEMHKMHWCVGKLCKRKKVGHRPHIHGSYFKHPMFPIVTDKPHIYARTKHTHIPNECEIWLGHAFNCTLQCVYCTVQCNYICGKLQMVHYISVRRYINVWLSTLWFHSSARKDRAREQMVLRCAHSSRVDRRTMNISLRLLFQK